MYQGPTWLKPNTPLEFAKTVQNLINKDQQML
jgi:hypothetical protein